MQNDIFLIGDGIVITGTLILAIALLPVRSLFRLLPKGSVRSQWRILTVLILFFIFGYVVYGILNWNVYNKVFDLLVPAIFFFGAIFVFIICTLSLNTAQDMLKINVLQQENITDPLLGIFNRRYLDRRLKEEISRSRRYGLPLSILLLDIDHFKNVNDNYGHQAGDYVLKKFGELILDSVRETDIVARYGGEEVLVILPNTSESNAIILAERLRKDVEIYEIKLPGERIKSLGAIRLTVSIGVAGLSQTTLDFLGLIENVDMALYRAKEKGRNMVIASDVAIY